MERRRKWIWDTNREGRGEGGASKMKAKASVQNLSRNKKLRNYQSSKLV
jgi:hypothetical protein